MRRAWGHAPAQKIRSCTKIVLLYANLIFCLSICNALCISSLFYGSFGTFFCAKVSNQRNLPAQKKLLLESLPEEGLHFSTHIASSFEGIFLFRQLVLYCNIWPS